MSESAAQPEFEESVTTNRRVGPLAFLVVAIVIFVLGIVIQQFSAPIDRDSLTRSVELAVGGDASSAETNSCTELAPGQWQCQVRDRQKSAGPASAPTYSLYTVKAPNGASCWTATLASVPSINGSLQGKAMPKTLKGCVNHFQGGWSALLGI